MGSSKKSQKNVKKGFKRGWSLCNRLYTVYIIHPDCQFLCLFFGLMFLCLLCMCLFSKTSLFFEGNFRKNRQTGCILYYYKFLTFSCIYVDFMREAQPPLRIFPFKLPPFVDQKVILGLIFWGRQFPPHIITRRLSLL